MHQNPGDNFFSGDFSIEDLKNNLAETNASLLETLKGRYMQDLFGSMVFFIFNEVCKQRSDEFNHKNPFSKQFFEAWKDHTKKRAKREILEINKKLKMDPQMNFLGAISNFSLPSTEDYQSIYDKALSEVQNIFEKNTEI
jgi:hypothetical protein